MDEEILPVTEEVEETTGETLEGQTIFIPKDESGYSVPESGTAQIEFTKIAEDDAGCTIKVTSFEGEEAPDINAIDDSMEDAIDHADSFINKRENQQAQERGY